MIDLHTNPIVASASSVVTDGATTTALGAGATIGTATGANGKYVLLRFDISTLVVANLEVTELIAEITVNGANTPDDDIKVWAANFGSALTIADYTKADLDIDQTKSNAFRVPLKRIATDGVAISDGTKLQVVIPTEHMRESDGFLDLLIAIEASGTGGTNGLAIHGPTAVTTSNQPRLLGYAYTRAEIDDPGVSGAARCTETADATMAIGFGMETYPGRPVKPNIGLLVESYNIGAQPAVHTSRATNRYKTKGLIQARARVMSGGNASCDLTIQSWTPLLRSMFTGRTDTDLGVVAGVHSYERIWDVADPCSTERFTFFSVDGHEYVITPGAVITGLTFTIPTNGLLTMGLDFVGLEPLRYDQNAAGGTSALEYLLSPAYSTDIAYAGLSDSQVTTTIDGVAESSILIEGGSISIRRGGDPVFGETGQVGATVIVPGKPMVTGSFTMLFRQTEQVRRYFGVSHTRYPYKVESGIIYQPIRVDIAGPLGAAAQLLRFDILKAGFSNMTLSQAEDQAVRVTFDYEAIVDTSVGSGLVLTTRNSHPTSYYNRLTDHIKVLPVGKLSGANS